MRAVPHPMHPADTAHPLSQPQSPPPLTRGHWWWLAGTGTAVVLALGGWVAWEMRPPPKPAEAFVFRDDFEGVTKTEDLFPADRSRWSGVQCESGSGTKANIVTLTSERSHSGRNALKCVAEPFDGKTASKADIERGGLRFVKGDHVWFKGWFWVAGGTDASLAFLWDLETTSLRNSPGRRLFLQDGEVFASDLGKWWTGKSFRQNRGAEVKFPKDRWVEVKIHLLLSEGRDGRMEVWQDGVKVLDSTGKTLPRARTVYDRLQIGLTANGGRNSKQTLFVDDVVLSNRPL